MAPTMRHLASVFAFLLVAGNLHAAMFDFTDGVPMPPSAFGNSVTLTDGGVTVVLTGWHFPDTSSGAFPGQVKVWSTGAGICNQSEGLNCGSGPHTAGNQNGIDFFFLEFSVPVLPQSALITAWARDFDVSFWGGSESFDMSPGEWGISALGTQHNDFFGANNASAGSTTRLVDLTGLSDPIQWLAFGAYTGHTNDKFKFRVLTVTPVEVSPEPGTLLLLASAGCALVVGGRRRRRNRKQ